ncbi:MAG: YihY/virulence factor BrkB family protein [Anaerolineales bacterium]|nr:YihY/virulence factor BrkB family protein [Anaerolineales bacterium]
MRSSKAGRCVTIQLIKRTIKEWLDDNASRLAAALAFYTILSIPPLLVLLSMIVAQFAGQQQAQQAIIQQAQKWLVVDAVDAIRTILEAATQPTNFSLAAIVSIAVLFFSASGVFVHLQESLNSIWNVKPDPDEGIMNMVRKRIVSFVMIFLIALLFLLLLVASSVVGFLGNVLSQNLPGSWPVFRVLNFVLALVVLAGIFALVYRTLPDAEIQWRDVALGAGVTAVLFLLGALIIGLFLNYSSPTSSYGAAGSIIALMLWIYYSAQVFFLGAEFTQVYANMYGSHIRPEEGAVRVETVERTYRDNAVPAGQGQEAD